MKTKIMHSLLLFFWLGVLYGQKPINTIEAYKMDRAKRIEQSKKETLAHLQSLADDSCFRLDLSNLDLKVFPELKTFHFIKQIRLEGNYLQKIPKTLFVSDNLNSVNLSRNKLKRIRVMKNIRVKEVDLSHNLFTSIPRSLRKFKSLKRLDLSGNQIRRIPRFILKMDSLSEIKLNHNSIKLKKRSISHLQRIKQLQLADNDLAVLPDCFSKLNNLEHLNLGMNKLKDLPPGFGQLKNLEHLIFYKNNFCQIPIPVFKLKKLKELDFYYNRLQSIPDEIQNMKELQFIFLSFNKIQVLPEFMGKLKKVRGLFIHHNQLVYIPEWIKDWQALEVLDLGFNQLTYLPDLGGLRALYEVDLQSNNLEHIPYSLIKKTGIKRVYLLSNPFLLDTSEVEIFKNYIKDLEKKDIHVFY
jgi:Leucine-rich repeat (LRR) protein